MSGRYKILYIEDNFFDQDLVKNCLEEKDEFEVTIASTASEGMVYISKNEFDLILLDNKLPDMNGIEILKKLGNVKKETPVIIFTSKGNDELVVESLREGAATYISKASSYIDLLPPLLKKTIEEFKSGVSRPSRLSSLSKKILYIERTHTDIDLTREKFNEIAPNLAIDAVDSTEKGLEILSQPNDYDIVLIDLRMQRMNALDFLREIKLRGIKIPVIILTGYGDEEVAMAAIHLGAFDYIVKRENYLLQLPYSIYNAINRFNTLSINESLQNELIKLNRSLEKKVEERTNQLKEEFEERKKLEEKYRDIFYNHSAVKILIDSETGEITDINKSAEKFLNVSPDKLIGTKAAEIFGGISKYIDNASGRIKFSNLDVCEFEILKNGKPFKEVEAFCNSIQQDNKIIWELILHDITEKRKIEEKANLLKRAIEQSPVTVVVTDTNGIIEYANPVFTKVTGYSLEEAIGRKTNLLKSGRHAAEFYQNLWDTIKSGKQWSGEFLNKKKDGTLYWEDAVIFPVINRAGNITNYVAIKEDITEKKKMIRELIEAKEKAEEMNRVKSIFFANMSHELRTPFVGIMGYAELLRELIDDDELREMAEGIYRTSQRMVDTLSKILDITKIESEKIEVKYTEVNIRRLLEDICNEYCAAIKSKNLYLKKDFNNLPDKILSDEKLISEIISNLISNAIKFTSKGGIEIKAETRTEKQMNFLALSVSDTGIGIPREKIDLIWEEFRQVSEGSSRDFQGTGLGLAISKKYTELLGGKISVESEYGAGSTFLVEIPLL
jgi:hypothetical protein